jgi:hypothetical protein
MACAALAAASSAAARRPSLVSVLLAPIGIQMCTRPSLVPARDQSHVTCHDAQYDKSGHDV